VQLQPWQQYSHDDYLKLDITDARKLQYTVNDDYLKSEIKDARKM
jgi:hypothetical protein